MKRAQAYIEKILSFLLYLLPILFLIVCYFFMTVTAEDILQGAGMGNSFSYIISDIKNAFEYNSRLSDMYAWCIINNFDLSFSFGIDTIFRSIDVFLVYLIIYFLAIISIKNSLKLRLSNAIVFCVLFVLIFLSKFSEPFYVAFSHIHNYTIICFFSILFFVPFAQKLQGKEQPRNKFLMLILGFLFGFSSNITPIAFLICFFICSCIRIFIAIKDKDFKINDFVNSWEFFAVIGVLIAIFIMYVCGSGYSGYTKGTWARVQDYVSVKSLFTNPQDSILKIIAHIKENFSFFCFWLIMMFCCLIFEVIAYKKRFFYKEGEKGIIFISVGILFVVIHILIMSQIFIDEILRLAFLAYIVAISVILFSVVRISSLISVNFGIKVLVSLGLIFIMGLMVYDMGMSRLEYNKKVQPVIKEIVEADKNKVIYIYSDDVETKESEIFGFWQYPLIQGWILSSPVCGKQVRFID